jgi:hypothetical protein
VSVVITAKFQGDTAKFRQALVDRAGEFEKFGESARAGGCLHHRFGVGDGFVLVIDEWESLDQFQRFFGNPDLQAFIGTIGADPAPPEMAVAEAVASPDQS